MSWEKIPFSVQVVFHMHWLFLYIAHMFLKWRHYLYFKSVTSHKAVLFKCNFLSVVDYTFFWMAFLWWGSHTEVILFCWALARKSPWNTVVNWITLVPPWLKMLLGAFHMPWCCSHHSRCYFYYCQYDALHIYSFQKKTKSWQNNW